MKTLREKAIEYLVGHVEEILSKQNEKGEFWPDAGFPARWNTDYQQFAYYPLAYLFTLDHPLNSWRGDARLLRAVEKSFSNNLEIQDEKGQFAGSSHDSKPTHHPGNWRAFSWLRSWELLRSHINKSLAQASEEGLRRALNAEEAESRRAISEAGYGENHNVRNHPIWHLTATYALAKSLSNEKVTAFAAEQIERVCAVQHPAGIWHEHDGPVAVYQHVAMSGIAHFHALSGSPAAGEALRKALNYYRIFTYPAGHPVETMDGRVRYTGYALSILPATWAALPEGRAYLHLILDKLNSQPLGPGYQTHGGWLGLPFFTQFVRELPETEPAPDTSIPAILGDGIHKLPKLPALLLRQGKWTVVLSAFTRREIPDNRWTLDYQGHLSIFHEDAGLVVIGGGGKRQAALSLFTGGSRPLGLPCLASSGSVEETGKSSARLNLKYPDFDATLNVEIAGSEVRLSASTTGDAVHLQLPFLQKGEAKITYGKEGKFTPDAQHELTAEVLGENIGREGKFTLSGFSGARALLHILPYNTHWKNAWAPTEKAVGAVAQPLTRGVEHKLVVKVL
jgi:hypothetical protein